MDSPSTVILLFIKVSLLLGGILLVNLLRNARSSSSIETVIVMTFWYVFGTDLLFSNFFKTFIIYLGLITTPHVLYVHMTYVYSFFLCLILHTITWPREVIIVL